MDQEICFICYGDEEEKLMTLNEYGGCLCKGSIKIHYHCFNEWVHAKKSLHCSICNSPFSVTKLSKFISSQDLLIAFLESDCQENDDFCILNLDNFLVMPIYFDNFKIKFYKPEHHDLYLKVINSLRYSERYIILHNMMKVIISLLLRCPVKLT